MDEIQAFFLKINCTRHLQSPTLIGHQEVSTARGAPTEIVRSISHAEEQHQENPKPAADGRVGMDSWGQHVAHEPHNRLDEWRKKCLDPSGHKNCVSTNPEARITYQRMKKPSIPDLSPPPPPRGRSGAAATTTRRRESGEDRRPPRTGCVGSGMMKRNKTRGPPETAIYTRLTPPWAHTPPSVPQSLSPLLGPHGSGSRAGGPGG